MQLICGREAQPEFKVIYTGTTASRIFMKYSTTSTETPKIDSLINFERLHHFVVISRDETNKE